MIRKQAQALCGRDTGRTVTATDPTTGRTASGTLAGILFEGGHGWLMITDQDPPLHVRPDTEVEVNGARTA